MMTNPYEDIIENLTEAVIGVDCACRITVFNQAAERLTELSRKKAIGKTLSEIFSLDPWLAEVAGKTIDIDTLYSDYGTRLHRRFSPPLMVTISTSRMLGDSGVLNGVAILIKDVSAIKSIENEELRKDRLAHLGTFAANLAHEVKNPLSGIKGAAQLLSRRSKDKVFKELTGVIVKESDRLNLIVCEMLDFNRAKKPARRNLNIHKVLDNVITLVEKEGESTEGGLLINKAYDPSLPELSGSSPQLIQVFLNIIKNARDAVLEVARKDKNPHGKPRIVVTTRLVSDFKIKQTQGTAKGRKGLEEKTFALIEVSDNGIGIAEKDLEEVFTPFFTTKHKGSGLGMGISYKIIKEHSGYIKIASQPGEGTKVTVYLPLGATKK